jgi:hypothetical protein
MPRRCSNMNLEGNGFLFHAYTNVQHQLDQVVDDTVAGHKQVKTSPSFNLKTT